MAKSTRLRVLLWLVWLQPVLIAIAICMIAFTDPDRVWRWNVPFWTLLVGYLLGFLLLPFSRGLEKPSVLKWWLRIDLVITILMFVPAYFTLAGCEVKYSSDKGAYILFSRGGFLSAPHINLGVKSGLFITDLNYFPVGYVDISDYDWDIDSISGCFELFARYNNKNRIYICPTDSNLYHENRGTINHRIDSLYYEFYPKGIDNMDFVMPDDFSRIVYTDSSDISYYKADDDWYPSTEIIFTSEYSNMSPDSVIIRCNDSKEDRVCPKDSFPHMSPTRVQQFIRQLKGGKL
ncbi:hypothetical protein [uncultured Duncaniella sp.]|uniref:hypothetical protein n=1 Tax=uncultured Duncaniella sp. TaxID=2768039 RepID=UPI0025B75153|nr:hypothetical protein [uncultured Duncaniella sp.]